MNQLSSFIKWAWTKPELNYNQSWTELTHPISANTPNQFDESLFPHQNPHARAPPLMQTIRQRCEGIIKIRLVNISIRVCGSLQSHSIAISLGASVSLKWCWRHTWDLQPFTCICIRWHGFNKTHMISMFSFLNNTKFHKWGGSTSCLAHPCSWASVSHPPLASPSLWINL